MQPDGDEFVPASDGAQPKTGVGGVREFNFKADGSGEATLTFTYARSWEASDSDKSVVLHATVETARSRRLKSRRKHQRAEPSAVPPFSCGML